MTPRRPTWTSRERPAGYRTTMTVRLACALLTLALLGGTGSGLRAQDAPAAPWERVGTGLGGFVRQLHTPTSGAFIASTTEGVFRSDDGGLTWGRVSLPPQPGSPGREVVAVHPADHTILYVTAERILYRSADDGITWTPIAPTPNHIALSPADRDLIYLLYIELHPEYGAALGLRRSRDGGATWERLPTPYSPPPPSPSSAIRCSLSPYGLWAHPTDAGRVFTTGGCSTREDHGGPLFHSADQGITWSALTDAWAGFPDRLVGCPGAAAGRFFLVVTSYPRPGNVLLRSDDDGYTWSAVLDLAPHGVGALTCDPNDPDRVYVHPGPERPIHASADGGVSWSELPSPARSIYDLAVGVDSLYLFAAADKSVYRMRLDR